MKKKAVLFFLVFSLLTFLSCMKEDFGGIGIEVPTGAETVSKTNRYRIESVFRGGPGESAGLKSGDIIVSIDNLQLDGLRQEYIVKNLLRGKIGSMVLLEIERETDKEKKLILYRIPRMRIVVQD